ncbi:PARP3 [Symbiodinium sp. CCMP2592]|nr:PARP3 [Symbiodinium sp. CCMP2592]
MQSKLVKTIMLCFLTMAVKSIPVAEAAEKEPLSLAGVDELVLVVAVCCLGAVAVWEIVKWCGRCMWERAVKGKKAQRLQRMRDLAKAAVETELDRAWDGPHDVLDGQTPQERVEGAMQGAMARALESSPVLRQGPSTTIGRTARQTSVGTQTEWRHEVAEPQAEYFRFEGPFYMTEYGKNVHGAELENGPERKKSMSRSGHQHSDDDDFDQFSEAEHDDATAPKGSLSSDSGGWTPSFAGRSEPPNTPQTADEEESRGPVKPVADGRRLPSRPPTVPLTGSGVQGLQDFFTDEEDSSPLAPKKSVPRIPLAPPKRPQRAEAKEQISKPRLPSSTSQSFLSDSDSDAKSPPARSSTMPILMEEPIDLSTSPIQEESPIQPQSPLQPHSADLQLAPAQAQSREMRFPTKPEARSLQSSREDSPKRLVTLQPLPEVSLFVDAAEATHPPPTPQFDVTGSSAPSPELTPSPAASPAREKSFASPLSDASCGRIEDLGSSPSEAAATTTASLGVASRSIASNGSPRSPFSEETQDLSPSPLKRQLEELEEQQRQIQSSLSQALEYERRLRADEVARCHSLTAELLEALETERRRHSEDIRAWELRLQTQLNEHEAKWLSEAAPAATFGAGRGRDPGLGRGQGPGRREGPGCTEGTAGGQSQSQGEGESCS